MKQKEVTLININDFPIEINDDLLSIVIDYYQFLSIFIYLIIINKLFFCDTLIGIDFQY